MKKYTRTYRRDLPRNGRAWRKNDDGNAEYEDALKFVEQNRKAAVKEARDYTNRNADYVYNYGERLLQERGAPPPSVNATTFAGTNDAEFRQEAMQKLLTALSKAYNPTEKGKDGNGGGGTGNKDAQAQQRTAPNISVGGGQQTYGHADDESLFWAVRYLIRKLAEYDDPTDPSANGHQGWDIQKVLQSRYNPTYLPEAHINPGKQVENFYMVLDTSGSVAKYAPQIATIAASAAGIVHLYTGGEADPYWKVNRKTPLNSPQDAFPEWQQQESMLDTGFHPFADLFLQEYKHHFPFLEEQSFETLVAWWLHREKIEKGSRLLFWGDTHGPGLHAPTLLQQMLRPYKAAWLLSHSFEHAKNWHDENSCSDPHTTTEQILYTQPRTRILNEFVKFQLIGLPVIEDVTDATGMRRALTELQLRR